MEAAVTAAEMVAAAKAAVMAAVREVVARAVARAVARVVAKVVARAVEETVQGGHSERAAGAMTVASELAGRCYGGAQCVLWNAKKSVEGSE